VFGLYLNSVPRPAVQLGHHRTNPRSETAIGWMAAQIRPAQLGRVQIGRGPNKREPIPQPVASGSHRFRPVTRLMPIAEAPQSPPPAPCRQGRASPAEQPPALSRLQPHRRKSSSTPTSRKRNRRAGVRPEPLEFRPPSKPVLAGSGRNFKPCRNSPGLRPPRWQMPAGRFAGRACRRNDRAEMKRSTALPCCLKATDEMPKSDGSNRQLSPLRHGLPAAPLAKERWPHPPYADPLGRCPLLTASTDAAQCSGQAPGSDARGPQRHPR